MEKVGDEAATKFINALIKSVQTLCHGYLEFSSGIEIIGHINLMVDKGTSLDYILKEKVCKNAENSTLFISNSFHAEPKCEQEVSGKNSQQPGNQVVQNKQSTETGETGRLSSAISSISSALSVSRERSRRSSGTKDSDSSHSQQSTTKRKASDDHSSEFRPSKVSSHHDNVSHSSSESPFPPTSSSPVDSKAALQQLGTSEADMSETMLPQTANVTSDSSADIGVNLAGSVLEPVDDQSNPDLADRDDDSDGDLEVTFIKEEYVEGERSACEYENSSGQQFVGGPHQRGSESMPDPSLFPVALHTSSSASATYVPSAHDLGAGGQHFPPGSLGPSTSQPQPGPSSMRGNVSQQQAAHPLPPGARPGCGYVHPSDAQKWMMYELVPGSGVFIHQENYRTVMSKERDGQPDGKAMARYLMSCFWKQSELVGASIAEPPRPHHRSLDKGIINAILELCRLLGGCSKRDVQRALWWKISAANNAEKKRSGLADLQGRVGVLQSALDVGPPRGAGGGGGGGRVQSGRGGCLPRLNASSSASVAGFRPQGVSASVSGVGPARASASFAGVTPQGTSAAAAAVGPYGVSASAPGFTPSVASASAAGFTPSRASVSDTGFTPSRASVSDAGFTRLKTPFTEPLPTSQSGQGK